MTRNKIVIYLLSFWLSSAILAMDPEFATMNLMTAKIKGSEYKANPALPRHLHLAPGGVSTDTDLLVKALDDGNNADYLEFAKKGIIAIVTNWVPKLSNAGPNSHFVKRTGAANMMKKEFTDALEGIIDRFASATVPVDAKFRSLKTAKDAINQEIANAVKTWIDTLLVADGQFLNRALAGPVPDRPTDQTRDQFKIKIEEMIKTF